ncbi:MAG: radical SAM protein [Acidobacteria bacterium]|nr:radical SAM protein [Acidobacteriota bacterium]MCB9396530.1 radical SAM protein [Acidobacteriota bacterium]
MSVSLSPTKFKDPFTTAKGEERAWVTLTDLQTLWINTGTLCNLSCAHCYIESSPQNDRLAFISASEVQAYLDEIRDLGWQTPEIGLTGGEPLINPEIMPILKLILDRGFRVLILTNAYHVVGRHKKALAQIPAELRQKMEFRVSLDHFRVQEHDLERGEGTFEVSVKGLKWLADEGFKVAVAGRSRWQESQAEIRAGFGALFAKWALPLDAENPHQLVIFPEMDAHVDVPEITTACWQILNKRPESVMCASSRMVVKPKGGKPQIQACTLLAYEPEFTVGHDLASMKRDVRLNHPHCAKFCVLGGASCSV